MLAVLWKLGSLCASMCACLLCEDGGIGTWRCGMGGATAGSNRRLNLWSKTTSGLISAPPLMILAGQFYISETAGSFFFFRCSIWAVSLSFFKSPKSRVIQCTSLGLVAFACGAFVKKNVSIAVDHITAELPVSSLFSSEIYQHSAPCLHASCYCSMVLLPHGNSKIITPHTALLQRDETVSAPQIAATYWITGQHLDYWLSQRIFCSPQGALTRKGSSTSD